MKIKNVHFVYAYEFFVNHKQLSDVFASKDNYSFSWGDNAHSLISLDTFWKAIKGLDEISPNIESGECEDDYDATLNQQAYGVWSMIQALKGGVNESQIYVNLEAD